MHNILYCDLLNFQRNQLSVAMTRSGQADETFDIFGEKKREFCTVYLKNHYS